MIWFAVEKCLSVGKRCRVRFPDFENLEFCFASQLEAERCSGELLSSLVEAWMEAGLAVPHPSSGNRAVPVNNNTAVRLALHWRKLAEARPPMAAPCETTGGDASYEVSEIVRAIPESPYARTAACLVVLLKTNAAKNPESNVIWYMPVPSFPVVEGDRRMLSDVEFGSDGRQA